jgi:hypothetical protein
MLWEEELRVIGDSIVSERLCERQVEQDRHVLAPQVVGLKV